MGGGGMGGVDGDGEQGGGWLGGGGLDGGGEGVGDGGGDGGGDDGGGGEGAENGIDAQPTAETEAIGTPRSPVSLAAEASNAWTTLCAWVASDTIIATLATTLAAP